MILHRRSVTKLFSFSEDLWVLCFKCITKNLLESRVLKQNVPIGICSSLVTNSYALDFGYIACATLSWLSLESILKCSGMQPNPLHWVDQFILGVKHHQTARRLARNAINDLGRPGVGFSVCHLSRVGEAHQHVMCHC